MVSHERIEAGIKQGTFYNSSQMYIMGTTCPTTAINSYNNTKWKLKINILPTAYKKNWSTDQKQVKNIMHETKHTVSPKSTKYKVAFLSVV